MRIPMRKMIQKMQAEGFDISIEDVEKAMPAGELIGLHIRRTDHVKCIAASPLEAFEEIVSKVLASHEGYAGRFLLATDDAAVKERFRDLFGDAIVSPVVTLGRMTESQQEMGVVDWLLLQGCQKIYASAGSSFCCRNSLICATVRSTLQPFAVESECSAGWRRRYSTSKARGRGLTRFLMERPKTNTLSSGPLIGTSVEMLSRTDRSPSFIPAFAIVFVFFLFSSLKLKLLNAARRSWTKACRSAD